MAAMSLWDAAEKVGTSKSAIWRAIKDGRLAAVRDDSGNFSVDPNEVISVLSLQEPARVEPADAPILAPASVPAAANRNYVSAEQPAGTRLAALEAEVAGMKLMLAEIRMNRDDLRADRDAWRGQAERLMATLRVDPPSRWKRIVGGGGF
jgi:hypothetical protein